MKLAMPLRLAASLACLALCACSLPPKGLVPDNTYVTRFENVDSASEVWTRLLEIQAESEKTDIKSLPVAYRQCIGDQIVRVSPPELNRQVDKFAKSHLYDDFYDMIGPLKSFGASFERQRGMKLYPYASAVCEGKGVIYPAGATYREMLTNGMAAKWKADGLSREKQPKYFACIVDETIATFTEAELKQLNDFASDSKRTNPKPAEDAFAARDKRFGGSSDGQVLGKCAVSKGS
ncbi:hypothetical protein [Dongia rigui]|uniref:Lipoprotein n=1 Tax=Dongia rigui TaxID=940149 RepID=A0ABU5E324_9PROT|nr:hypothetical protein [Dongia rigui]MDY0873970.1 hypothetical protein [Dongia rigui]